MAVGAFAEVTTGFLNSAEVHDPETPAPSRSVSAARPASHHWQQHISTLSFVDLAGSERVKKPGSSGNQLKEAQCINKSLSALVDVISALSSDGQHIPYRNHKLTMVMSDSPGGNAKTLMFVNLSLAESNLDETYNSLMYASRARCIVNDPSKNVSTKKVARLKKLVSCWKEQAGKRAEEEELEEIQEERPTTKEKSDGRLSM